MRADGLLDYVTGILRECGTCSTKAYDYEYAIIKQLPHHLQEELGHQLTGATKGVGAVMSKEMAAMCKFSFTASVGAAGRGLHSSTFRLGLSAFCVTGAQLGVVSGVFKGW